MILTDFPDSNFQIPKIPNSILKKTENFQPQNLPSSPSKHPAAVHGPQEVKSHSSEHRR